MAIPKYVDRVWETTETTGTGTYTLAGAKDAYRAFSAVGDGSRCFYACQDDTSYEVGFGTYTASGTTLSRDRILASSNSNSPVDWAGGTKQIYLVRPAMQQTPDHSVCQGRLTLTSGTPVPNTDVTGASTIFFTPFNGNLIGIFDGDCWGMHAFTELSLSLSSLTSGTNYDVWVRSNSGTLTLDHTAWASNTTRATGLAMQDGVYCKSGDTTRRYLGTFRSTSTTATEDSLSKRFLWNNHNRKMRRLRRNDNTANWVYSTPAWRPWNNTTANRMELVVGLDEEPVCLQFIAFSSGANVAYVSFGLDSTSSASGNIGTITSNNSATVPFSDFVGIGYHYIQLLEKVNTTMTFYGISGGDQQNGARGFCMA